MSTHVRPFPWKDLSKQPVMNKLYSAATETREADKKQKERGNGQ